MINPGSNMGGELFKCAKGTAGQEGTEYIRLVGWEECSGGDINNESSDYTTCTEGVALPYALGKKYSNLTITSADDLDEEAYGDGVVALLTDAVNTREKFDLVKMSPRENGNYKVIVFTVLSLNASEGATSAKSLQSGTFEFAVKARKEFTGTIVDGKPVLTART